MIDSEVAAQMDETRQRPPITIVCSHGTPMDGAIRAIRIPAAAWM